MIRRATTSDASALTAVDAAAFAGSVELPWSERAVLATLGSPDTLARVVEEDGRVSAWIAFRRILDEAELLRVAVDPIHRRRGLGRSLVEHGLDALRADGVTTCHLEVRDGNLAAIGLYEGLGFEVVGRRPGYYPGGVDALLLQREG